MKHYIILTICLFIFPISIQATTFKTYDLTEDQLTRLSRLCNQEQGTVEGAAAEASLMANRFELYGQGFGTGADGLYNYVRTSRWFADAAHFMDNGTTTTEITDAVRNVLIAGKRTLPGYVDEHDSKSDIISVTNDEVAIDINDDDSYVPFKTIIKNGMSSTYTFYSFPADGSDPFGYISETNRQNIGETHYDLDGAASGSSGAADGMLNDPFTGFPNIKDEEEFTCETILLTKDETGKIVDTNIKKF